MPSKRKLDGQGTLNNNNNDNKDTSKKAKINTPPHQTRSKLNLSKISMEDLVIFGDKNPPSGEKLSQAWGRLEKFQGSFALEFENMSPVEQQAFKKACQNNPDITNKELQKTPNGKNRYSRSPSKTLYRAHSTLSTSAGNIKFFKNTPPKLMTNQKNALLEKFAKIDEAMVAEYKEQLDTAPTENHLDIQLPKKLQEGKTRMESLTNLRLTKAILQASARKNNRDVSQKSVLGKSAKEFGLEYGLTNIVAGKKSLLEISHVAPASFGGLLCTREVVKKQNGKKTYRYTSVKDQSIDESKFSDISFYRYAQLEENLYISSKACNTHAMLYEMLCRYLTSKDYIVMLNIDKKVFEDAPKLAKKVYYSIVWGHENEQGVFKESNHLNVNFSGLISKPPSTHDYSVLLTLVKLIEDVDKLSVTNTHSEKQADSSPHKDKGISDFFSEKKLPPKRILFAESEDEPLVSNYILKK